jgi:HEPN domain-containing protein
MCQQAVEKLVKGLYVLYIDDNVPRTHNIRFLVKRLAALMPEKVTDEQYRLFDDLTLNYIDGRYTDYKRKLSEFIDKATAGKYLKETKEAFSWLLTMKP